MTQSAVVDHAQLEKDVALAAQGDGEAWDRAAKVLVPVLHRQLHRFRLSPEDHLDIVQNTLIRLQQRLGDYRGDARFVTWATRVGCNEALMYLRSERRLRLRVVDAGDVDLDAFSAPEPDDAFDGSGIRTALQDLPTRYRHVLEARYGEDQSLDAIARQLRTSTNSVRSSLMRARRMLRGRLQKAGIASFAQARAAL